MVGIKRYRRIRFQTVAEMADLGGDVYREVVLAQPQAAKRVKRPCPLLLPMFAIERSSNT